MDEVERLRRALRERAPGQGKRYPAELRARAAAWVKRRRAEGMGWGLLGAELGVRWETLRSWCRTETAPPRKLARVTVVKERRRHGDDSPERTLAVVVSPSGYRIEGLALADIVSLLRALG